MKNIDIEAFNSSALQKDPFEFVIVPEFIKSGAFNEIISDYPKINHPGSFPLDNLKYGSKFANLIDELCSDEFCTAVSKKFNVPLTSDHRLITVRGNCRKKDGKVHTDSKSKIISMLIYMNSDWEEKSDGRLRLLRSDNIEDVAVEIPPIRGTMLIFKRAHNSFHGHKSFVGKRQVIQINWLTSDEAIEYQNKRHAFSALIKKINPFKKSEY